MTINQETGLYGAYDFVYEPFFRKAWFIIMVVLAGIIFLIFVFYILYKIINFFQNRNITPFVRAEKKIKKIKTQSIKLKNVSDFILLLQDIVIIFKRYWEEETKQEIMQYTPSEFSFILRHYCSNQKTKNEIEDFFDLVEKYLFSSEEITFELFEKLIDQSMILLKSLDRQLSLK